MKSSHILALSLLIISPAAFARITLNTKIYVPHLNRTYVTQHNLDEVGATSFVDADETTRIGITLLAEEADNAQFIQTISVRAENGEYQNAMATSIMMPYNEETVLEVRATEAATQEQPAPAEQQETAQIVETTETATEPQEVTAPAPAEPVLVMQMTAVKAE